MGSPAGLCSLLGMWATLIIMEVIPFLALAVGADNMFILAHALHRQPACDAAGWAHAVLVQSLCALATCTLHLINMHSCIRVQAGQGQCQ